MRPKQDNDVTILGNMCRECCEARYASERHTTYTSQRKALTPILLHDVNQTACLKIDFIRAYSCSEECVLCVQAVFWTFQCFINSRLDHFCWHSSWKVGMKGFVTR